MLYQDVQHAIENTGKLLCHKLIADMRRIGSIQTNANDAQRFCDYLVTLSIDSQHDENRRDGNPTWDIWVRDEEDVEQARTELAQFLEQPGNPKYSVKLAADKIRDDKIADNQRRLKNQQTFASRTPTGGTTGMLGNTPVRQQGIPVTIGIIVLSVLCTIGSNMCRPRGSNEPGRLSLEEEVYLRCSFVDARDYQKSDSDPLASIKKGEVWRFVTPMLLHGSMMHLAFNMMMMFYLGSALERIHGSAFFLALAVGTHVLGMMLQISLPDASALPEFLHRLAGSPFAVGASGAVYGLFGYIWIRPEIDSQFPIRMSPMNVAVMLGWLVLGVLVVDRIANGAHIGGLIGGIIAAVIAVQMTQGTKT